jgi:hypothetical protein
MHKILIPSRSGSDWQRFLAKPTLHWKCGASAMTAAACWEAASSQLPPEMRQIFRTSGAATLSELELLMAVPEWEVALPGGATTSHTDVMAICRNEGGLVVIAVEAKVLEPFGETVGEKRSGASEGQLRRLLYLQQLLHVDRFDDAIRYQLLHRTASALLTARQFHARSAVMAVHAFGTPADRRRDFDAFAGALGARRLSDDVFEVDDFEPTLHLAWCEGDRRFLQVELAPCADIAAPA